MTYASPWGFGAGVELGGRRDVVYIFLWVDDGKRCERAWPADDQLEKTLHSRHYDGYWAYTITASMR